MLNVVSQISQGGDVLRGMLSYDVQGHFVCKMFMALITFIITVRDGEAHVVLDGISIETQDVMSRTRRVGRSVIQSVMLVQRGINITLTS